MAAQLGFVQAFFQADPELAALLKAAVAGQWDAQRFQAAFMNTNWYRSRVASDRQWVDLETRDPAEAARKRQARKAELEDRISQLGASIDPATLDMYVDWSLRYSWTNTETTNILGSLVDYTPGNMGGTPAAIEMQVNKLASDYGLTLTSAQLSDYVSGIVTERYTQDNIADFMRDMAKSKYVGMGAYLDKGMTVREVASNYTNSYARLLEVDDGSVNLNDNLIQQALQGSPTKPGEVPQMQSLYQFERSVRRDPRWLRTKNARDSMVNAVQGIAQDWGLVG